MFVKIMVPCDCLCPFKWSILFNLPNSTDSGLLKYCQPEGSAADEKCVKLYKPPASYRKEFKFKSFQLPPKLYAKLISFL